LNKKLLSIFKFLFFLSLGIFLVWLSVKDFTAADLDHFYRAIQMADYSWIILSMLLGVLSHFLRAVRWVMLLEPVGYKPSTRNTFFAVMVGYLANFAFTRLGEVTRCGVLTKYEKIPFPVSFGTVIVERTFDMLCLFLIFVYVILAEYDRIQDLAREYILNPAGEKFNSLMANTAFMWAAAGIFVATLAIFIVYRKKINAKVSGKPREIISGFWKGLISVKNLRSPGWFLMHTAFIWILYYVMLHVCFFSFSETSGLDVGQGLSVLIMGAVGVIFTQGGIGAYQFLVTKTLASPLAGISLPIAGAFSWIVWASQFVTLVLVGLISLILLPILNRDKSGNDV
jgi:glycosyltransferase 2 family protein